MQKIDFVVAWVDGSDPEWQKKYLKYRPAEKSIMNGEIRYREYGTFKYWFRSVEKYAPWVNKIYVITDNQVPSWLNEENDKIEIIDHRDFIDSKYLPTFNSSTILLHIDRIKNLSEKFVLFNDDMFLNDEVTERDFFRNDLPVDTGTFQPTIPTTSFTHLLLNDVLIINSWFDYRSVLKKNFKKYFSYKYGIKRILSATTTLPFKKIIGFYDEHLATPYLKSDFSRVTNKATKAVEKTSLNKFRTNNDINEWIVRYYEYCTGKFVPRKKGFGKFYELKEYKDFVKDIKESSSKVVCINDSSDSESEFGMKELNKMFSEKFPEKSCFEK
ncbi:stealth family protein [Pediococcus pentosaceus]|uniref:stealth family protein n=1 Tax=Pediococcus pentosaceus TaxID=1255 RepID=UPI002658AD84|nr:stealth family protein [Pediococcus pentosaceus]WKF71650.1 stealth family protein [Pediococcus pentosaceus]